jgi:hypothetical protein
MSLLGRLLLLFHPLSALALAASSAIGYTAGRESTLFVVHIQTGFFIGLLVGFTQAMTLFYFAGMGVAMRQAAAERKDLETVLVEASDLRRRLAPLLGFALVAAMAAVVLGGGAHTRMLPGWPHELLALIALVFNTLLAYKAPKAIRSYESLVDRVEAGLGG